MDEGRIEIVTASENTLPVIGVLGDKFAKGLDHLEGEADFTERVSFGDAFTKQFGTDAHFVCYKPSSDEPYPRCNKPALPHLRRAGFDLLSTCFAVDWDTPDHLAWSEQSWANFGAMLETVEKVCPAIMQWTVMYTTNKGCRLVYALDTPIPVDEAERRCRWFVKQLIDAGFKADPLFDWTRLFRLPHVLRDGKPTYETMGDRLQVIWQAKNRLVVSALGSMESNEDPRLSYGRIRPVDDDQPSDHEARSLIWALTSAQEPDVGGKMTDYGRAARHRLTGRESYPIIFEQRPMAEKGERNTAMTRMVGEVVGLLCGVIDTEPSHVYGLFLEHAAQFDIQDNTAHAWRDVLWSLVCRMWGRQTAKQEEMAIVQAEVKVEETKADLSTLDRMIAGYKTWCHHPLLLEKETGGATTFIKRRLMACKGKTFYLISEDGTFDARPLMSSQMISEIRGRDMGWCMTTTRTTPMGEIKDRDTSEIVNEYAVNISDVHIVCPTPGISGGVLVGMDKKGTGGILQIPGFHLNEDLEPTYFPEIDEWLQHFATPEHYERLIQWLAWYPEFHQPIAALSIKGDEGAGKKLLVRGCEEVLRNPISADATSLTGDFNYGLEQSPLLVVDEDWPGGRGAHHPAAVFRRLTGGSGHRVNRKNLDPVLVKIPTRIILTSNNEDVIEKIVASKTLTPQDQNALAARILHMDIGNSGSIYLRGRGGLKHTAAKGRRWIAGDGGEQSNYILARHILYLHKTARSSEQVTGRFAVPGNFDRELMFKMRTQAGTAPVVVEAILLMLDEKTMRPGIYINETAQVFVTAQQIFEVCRGENIRASGQSIKSQDVTQVLRSLVVSEPKAANVMPGREDLGRKYWWDLDVDVLLAAAERLGFKASVKVRKIWLHRQALGQGIEAGAFDLGRTYNYAWKHKIDV